MKKSLVFILLYWFLLVIACGIITLWKEAAIVAMEGVPDILFSFQQPSYVTVKDASMSDFVCDPTKTECKINFDLSPSFTGVFRASDFVCRIDGVAQSEADKCNPNTVIFASGTTIVTFTIMSKVDIALTWSRTIMIHNGPDLLSTDASGSGSSSSGMVDSVDTSSGITSDSGVIDATGSWTWEALVTITGTVLTAPPVQFVFQQATYLLDKNPELAEYFCDPSRPDCKVNFDFTSSFTGEYRESEYFCHIDGITESESGKCNPAQVTFGTGTTFLTIAIRAKADPNVLSSRQILIHGKPENSTSSGSIDEGSWATSSGEILMDSGVITDSWSISGSGEFFSGIIIPEPIITIQSGLESDFSCNKSECIINLNGESSFGTSMRMADFSCSWSFSGAKSVISTETCNPSYVHYLPGTYEVRFRITSHLDPGQYREKIVQIKNIYTTTVSSSSVWGITWSVTPLQAVIAPQWPWSQYKFVRDWTVFCYTDKEFCSVNFTGEESTAEHTSSLRYVWDFWNGMTSTRANPGSFSLPLGIHEIRLQITDEHGAKDESIYPVQILVREKNTTPLLPFMNPEGDNLWISRVSPNPTGSDMLEWIEIRNPFSITKNLDGCRIQDASGKKHHFSMDDTIPAGWRRKFFSIMTGISLSNTKEVISLFCEEKELSRITWDYPIQEDEIIRSSLAASGAVFESSRWFLWLEAIDIEEISRFLSGSHSTLEKRQKFLEATTNFSIKQGSGSETHISGKGFPGIEIQVIFLSGVTATGGDMSEYFSGSQIQLVDTSGAWSQDDQLPPGSYGVLLRARLLEADPWHILKKRKTFSIHATKIKQNIIWSKKISEKSYSHATFSIKLQAGRSKKISYSQGKILCRDKKCGVNLKIESSQKWAFVFEWNFWGKKKIYGENPKTFLFTTGNHIIILRALNVETGELISEKISVSIVPPPKKIRKKKIQKSFMKSKKSTIQIRPSFSESVEVVADKTPLVAYILLVTIASAGFAHLAWKKWSAGEIDSTFQEK